MMFAGSSKCMSYCVIDRIAQPKSYINLTGNFEYMALKAKETKKKSEWAVNE